MFLSSVEADWGSGDDVEGGWMREAAGEVNAEFKLKYLERGEEELRDRWWVEREEETDRLSLRLQLQIDGRGREKFGGRSLNAKSAKDADGEDFAFQEHGEKRISISPTGQEAERRPDRSHGLKERSKERWLALSRHPELSSPKAI